MFVTFTYLFFFVDVDLRSVCVWTLPWIRFALDATVRDFRECFEKSLYGRNLLLTIQNLSLLPRDIRSSRKMLCVCVWGNVLASGERGFQE